MRLIDADALYERACNLEAQALSYVGKIVDDDQKKNEWKTWSAILVERTAFKHDVFDAPTVQPSGWLEAHIAEIMQAGYEGREIEFRINGRAFRIREVPQ